MQKMKKLSSIALALVMMLALIPMVTPTAKAATTVINLAGLKEVLDKGGVAVLGTKIESTETLKVNSNCTIDLNGNYLGITSNTSDGIIIAASTTLTIKDSQYTGSVFDPGKLNVTATYGGIGNTNATLIIESGSVNILAGRKSGSFRAAAIGGIATSNYVNGGNLFINGGHVTAESVYGTGIGGGLDYSYVGTGCHVRISGGYVKAIGNYYDIGAGRSGNYDGGTLEVTGGTLELANKGTNVTSPVFKNCIIKGVGAEGFGALYDKDGTAVTVTFNKNASNATGNVARMTLTGEAQTLPTNTLTRKGYLFSGWATTKSGKVAYKNKASVAKIASGKKSVTLYAVWTKVTAPAKAVTSLKLTSPKTKQLKVTYKKVSDAAGYRIEYSTSKSFTKATTKSVHTTKLTYTLKSLSAKKTYYVRVTAYKTDSTKVKIYSKKTATKNLKTK